MNKIINVYGEFGQKDITIAELDAQSQKKAAGLTVELLGACKAETTDRRGNEVTLYYLKTDQGTFATNSAVVTERLDKLVNSLAWADWEHMVTIALEHGQSGRDFLNLHIVA